MRSAVPAEQWNALRELREGAEPTLPRLAAAAQVSVFSLRNQASRHGWGNYLFLTADAKAAAREAEEEAELAQAIADGTLDALAEDGAPATGPAQPVGAGPLVRHAASEGPVVTGSPAPPAAGTPEERLARVSDMLLGEVEAIGAMAQSRGRMPDKARIEAVGAMIRLLERVEEYAAAKGRAGAKDGDGDGDGEKADVLQRIDRRIEELARAYAKELVEGQPDGSRSGADPR